MVENMRPFLHQRVAGRLGDGVLLPDSLHDEAYLERVVMAVHSRAATLDELAGPFNELVFLTAHWPMWC